MAQALELLGVADQAAGAADVELALLGDLLAVANRAMVGEGIGRARLIAGHILDHLRDDVAGALDDEEVARQPAEAADLVAGVESDDRKIDREWGEGRGGKEREDVGEGAPRT